MAAAGVVLNYNVACIRCGRYFPIHIATEDLYRTGKIMACCNGCLIASKVAFDDWSERRMGHIDDYDLEQIDDKYAQEMNEQRRKNMPKYSEVK